MTTLASPMPSPCSELVATFRDDGKIEVGGHAPTKKWTPRVDGWRELIELSASRYGVPTAVVAAIMSLESGGDPEVESPAGAMGLMQLMPSTYNMLLGRTKDRGHRQQQDQSGQAPRIVFHGRPCMASRIG